MRLSARDYRPSISVVVAGLLMMACTGLLIGAISSREDAKRAAADLKKATAETAREREIARLAVAGEASARTETRIADSRRVATLSLAERDKQPERALILAVEAVQLENTIEARGSLLDALLTQPGAISSRHEAPDQVTDIAFTPDGETLAAAYPGNNAGGVALWDVRRHKPLIDKPLEVAEGNVWCVAFSPDGKTIAAGYGSKSVTVSGGVVLWDVGTHQRITEKPLNIIEGGNVFSLAFSPDGKTIAGGCRRYPDASGLVLWDSARKVQIAERPLDIAKCYITRTTYSLDGETLAIGFGDYTARHSKGGVLLRRTRDSKIAPDRLITVAEGEATDFTISPDGSTLAIVYHGRMSGDVMLWDARTNARLEENPLNLPEALAMCVAFSPDGRTLATGYCGQTSCGVTLWDVPLRRRLTENPIEVTEGAVTRATFSPDGKSLAVGYVDHSGLGRGGKGGVVIFDLDLGSWKNQARRIAKRNLTRGEWKKYFPDKAYHATFNDLPLPTAEKASTTSWPVNGQKKISVDDR